MSRIPDGLRPPPRDADPRELLRWARRMEMAAGVFLIAGGCLTLDDGWWSWALIGLGLLSLSGWSGVRAIIRKVERQPEILEVDPERRRAHARRFAAVSVPLYAVAGVIAGYLISGWTMAIFMGSLMGASGALGAWWSARRWG